MAASEQRKRLRAAKRALAAQLSDHEDAETLVGLEGLQALLGMLPSWWGGGAPSCRWVVKSAGFKLGGCDPRFNDAA